MPREDIKAFIEREKAGGATTASPMLNRGLPRVISDEEMNKLAPAPTSSETQNIDSPETKKRGIFSSIVAGAGDVGKEVYKSVARPLFTPAAGLMAGITGEDVELPEWVGSARGSNDPNKMARITGGAALEAAALIPGGKAIETLRLAQKAAKTTKVATPLLKLSLAEAKLAAKSGFASMAGAELGTNMEADAADVIGAGVGGALTGAAIGGVAPLVARGWSKVRGNYAKEAEDAFQASKKGILPDGPDGAGPSGKTVTSKSLHEVDEDLFPQAAPDATPFAEPIKKRALGLGFKESQVNVIEQASQKERALMREMLDAGEQKSKNVLHPKDPTAVAARPILEQVSHIKNTRKAAGAKLDAAVKAMPKKPVAITEQRNGLFSWLGENGVTVKKNGALNFGQSKFRTSASNGDRMILQELADEFRPRTLDKFAPGQIHKTPEEIRTLRQALREIVENKARSGEPLSNSIENLIDGLRAELNKPLVALSRDYAEANKNYAVTSEALTDYYKFLGKRFYNSTDELADMRIQEVLGRLVSNVPAVTASVLDKLKNAAKQTGMQLDDGADVRRLLYADEMINDAFGLTSPRSFQGGIERGVQNVAEGMDTVGNVASAATGRPGGLIAQAIGHFGKITPEKRIKVLRDLLADTVEASPPAIVPKGKAGAAAQSATIASTEPPKGLDAIEMSGKEDKILVDLIASITPVQRAAYLEHKAATGKAFPEFKAAFERVSEILKKKGFDFDEWKPVRKGDARSIEKAIREENGDFSSIKDMNRATFTVKNSEEMPAFFDTIGKQLKIVRTKNRMNDESAEKLSGYRDMLLNVEMSNGTQAEIQLVTPEMAKAKSSAHHFYGIARTLEAKAKNSGLSAAEKVELDAAKKKQVDIYEEAMNKMQKSFNKNKDAILSVPSFDKTKPS